MAYRDNIRTKQAESAAAAKGLGKNLNDTRLDSRGSTATGAQITRMVNESTPTQGRERLADDDFVGGVFNGTNQDFTLSRSVFGQNINMDYVEQSTGTLTKLTKTTNPAPSALQFYFDDLFTVRVGTAPQALDALRAHYITRL